jgi:hypothetical protein
MIKQQVHRLIELFALYRASVRMTDDELLTYGMLSVDFEKWDPDAIERERDEARTFAREVFQWADSYVPDSGWGEGWAEVIARSKALDWLKADQ